MPSSLDRGFLILNLLRQQGEPLGFQELLTKSSIPRASLARIMKSLLKWGFVEKIGRCYSLPSNLEGWQHAEAHPGFGNSRPHLETISADMQATVLLIQLEGGWQTSVHKVQHLGCSPMQEVGSRSVVHSTTPWSWLFLRKVTRKVFDEHFVDGTPLHLMAPCRKGWMESKRNGFSCERGHVFPEVLRLAAPIVDCNDRTLGAIGCALPMDNRDESSIHESGQRLLRHVRSYSLSLNPSSRVELSISP